jgi:hypothetical protein
MTLVKNHFILALALSVLALSFSGCDEDEPIEKPSEGPIAHYKLDGNSTDEIDGNHGTGTSMVYLAGEGVSGSAGYFNGVESMISIASPFDLKKKTISLWFNTKSSADGLRIIYALDHPGLLYGMTIISVEQTGENLAVIFNSSRELFSAPIEANTWYHVALVTDELQYKYFLNGVEVKSGNMAEYIMSGNGTTDAMIGCSRAFDRFFYGELDEIKVYNRALSSTEIEELANEFLN